MKIDERIEKENNRLLVLTSKRAAIDEQIRETQELLKKLSNQQREQKLDNLDDLIQHSNISIDELTSAFVNGDFYAIQEKFEQLKQSQQIEHPDDEQDIEF